MTFAFGDSILRSTAAFPLRELGVGVETDAEEGEEEASEVAAPPEPPHQKGHGQWPYPVAVRVSEV